MLIMGIGYAATSMLRIESVKSYVDGSKDSGTIDADPGSDVKFKVKVDNLFTNDNGDLEINDITVTVNIKDIDDGDDLEEESEEFDLDPEDDKTVDVNFKIPLEVDEDTFSVEIIAEGKDENNTKHTATESLDLRVKKETHKLLFTRTSLSTNNLKCSRNTQLSIGVMNLGTSQEDVIMRVGNDNIGLNKQISFSLDDDPFESESKYSTSIPIQVRGDVEAGTYPILIRAEYSDGAETKDTNVDLVVEDCEKKVVKVEEPPVQVKNVEEEQNDEVETIVTPPEEPIQEIIQEPESTDFFRRNLPIILIVGIDLIVIIVVIVLIAAWAKKK